MIVELEYRGEIEGKVCAICKLTFRENDIILSCPNCQSLFHENHLLEWLEINDRCPVCEKDFWYNKSAHQQDCIPLLDNISDFKLPFNMVILTI